jgi:hypothetical protein
LLVAFLAIRAASFFSLCGAALLAGLRAIRRAVRVIESNALKVKRAGRRDGGVPAQVRTVREA